MATAAATVMIAKERDLVAHFRRRRVAMTMLVIALAILAISTFLATRLGAP